MLNIREQVLRQIANQLKDQERKGLAKYGKTLDENNYTDYDWQTMIIEELIDAIQYTTMENNRLQAQVQANQTIDPYIAKLQDEFQTARKYDLTVLQDGIFHSINMLKRWKTQGIDKNGVE